MARCDGRDAGGDAEAHWSESLPPLKRTSARSPVGVEEILMEEMVQVKIRMPTKCSARDVTSVIRSARIDDVIFDTFVVRYL